MYIEFSQEVFAWLENEVPRLSTESEPKHELIHLFFHFLDIFLDDFDTAQSTLLQAIKLAEESAEFSWGLFLRHNLVLFWLHYDLLKLALFEAFSLLSLIGDERLHTSLHLPYACHDIVRCYILLDPVGYYKEIMVNTQDVLTQVSVPHAAAIGAYRHMLLAAAASKHTREAERLFALLQSLDSSSDFAFDFGLAYERLECWSLAKRYYLEAVENTPADKYFAIAHIEALLGAVRAHCALSEILEANSMISQVYALLSTFSRALLLGRLFEVEAHMALVGSKIECAVSFFTQAARIYLEFAWYREAVGCGLQAAELAHSAHLPNPMQALSFASQAAHMLPCLTQDIVQRFAAFSCQPLASSSSVQLLSAQPVPHKRLNDRDLAVLKTSLRVSLVSVHFPMISLLLFLLARAHLDRKRDFHLAISYLVWHIALERIQHLPLFLEDSMALLFVLHDEQKQVAEILLALLAAPPPVWLAQLSEELSAKQWRIFMRLLLRALANGVPSSIIGEVMG